MNQGGYGVVIIAEVAKSAAVPEGFALRAVAAIPAAVPITGAAADSAVASAMASVVWPLAAYSFVACERQAAAEIRAEVRAGLAVSDSPAAHATEAAAESERPAAVATPAMALTTEAVADYLAVFQVVRAAWCDQAVVVRATEAG